MNITSIEVEGFASIKRKTKFIFRPELHLVYGNVGSGKSSFFVDALVWCLYGTPYKAIEIKDVISDNSEIARVKLETEKGTIERIRTVDNTSAITLNGESVTQETLDSIIGIDKNMFFNSVVFGQNMTGFLLLDDNSRREIISRINIDFINRYIEAINLLERENEKEIRELSEEKIKSIEDSIGELESMKEFQKSLREREKKKKEAKARVAELKKKMLPLKKREKEIGNEMAAVSKKIDAAMHKVAPLRAKTKSLIEKSREIAYRKKTLEKDIQNMEEMQVCPTCKQTIPEKHKKKVRKDAGSEISKLEVELNKLNADIAEREKNIKEIEDRKEKLYRQMYALEKKDKEIAVHMKEIEGEMDYCLSILKESNDSVEEEYESKLARLKRERRKLEDRLRIKRVEAEAIRFWNIKVKEAQSKLYDMVLDSFAPLCNKFLLKLTNGKMAVQMKTKTTGKKRITNKFTIEVFVNERPVSFKRLSGGEKKTLSIALNLAFSMLLHMHFAGDWNLVVLDESFENLDDITIDRMIDILIDIKQNTGKTIILITHRIYRQEDAIVVNCVKGKNGTELTVEN